VKSCATRSRSLLIDHLRTERHGARAVERLREPGKHREVSVKRDPLSATHAERGEAMLTLQPSEFALDGNAATARDSLATAGRVQGARLRPASDAAGVRAVEAR
jgi:hypothetical protein